MRTSGADGLSASDACGEEALAALLGKDAGGLSASTVARLKDAWVDEHVRWSKRDLTAKRYVYFWVDEIAKAAGFPQFRPSGFCRCPYRKLYPTGARPRITRCLRSWETFSN
jgi:hypothetical protein